MGLKTLEEKLGICFMNKTLLLSALTSKSYAKEARDKDPNHIIDDNERLEFLGDSVIEVVVREYLYKNIAGSESVLSDIADEIVNNIHLSIVANDLGIKQHIRMGSGEVNNVDEKILGGALEALTGAIYLDYGLVKAKEFILKNIIK